MKSEKTTHTNPEQTATNSFFNKDEGANLFFQKKDAPSGNHLPGETNNTIPRPENELQHKDPEFEQDNGFALPAASRTKMESAFGTSFEEVRIHNNSESASMSQQINASAFTYGNDIYFNQNEYRPGSLEGEVLLAHELAHTVQQREGGTGTEHSEAALESDANQSAEHFAAGQVFSSDKMGVQKAMPKSKSGLKISRCSRTSSGPMGASRRATALANFRTQNSGLTVVERTKIENAITVVTAGNIFLEISYYDYYANHSIVKDPSITGNELALTDPNSNTRVNPSVLDPSYPNNRLGDLLLHEYVHTRHDQNIMGTGDYQEGDAYAVEYFFAERTGDRVRMGEILTLVSTPGTLTVPFSHPALQALFRKTYATLKILYQVIDTGTSPHPTSPLVTPTPITRDDARGLVAELVSVNASSRSAQLNTIITWASANYTAIGIPPI